MPHAVTDRLPAPADDARAVELASKVSSVTAARHLVADDLRDAGIPQAVLDDVLLVVTELLSNAVMHAQPLQLADSREGVILRWSVTGPRVLVDVTDGGGSGRPELRRSAAAESDGRGLTIVDAVAREWTVRSQDGRVTVRALVGPESGS